MARRENGGRPRVYLNEMIVSQKRQFIANEETLKQLTRLALLRTCK